MQNDEIEKRRCKKCGLLQTYYRSRTKDKICKACGHVEKVKNV